MVVSGERVVFERISMLCLVGPFNNHFKIGRISFDAK